MTVEHPRIERQKQAAAEAAAEFVSDGMAVGLGTGTTAAYLLPALARRGPRIRCVASSPRTEAMATSLGLDVRPFDAFDRLDIYIDGADQIAPDGWLIKGGGGAHTREKVVAAAADKFIVIADSTKLVSQLRPPVPVELLSFGLPATLRRLDPVTVRGAPPSPDGGVIADYLGPCDRPAELAARLSAVPGLVGHGLFEPALVWRVLVAADQGVRQVEP